MSQVTGLTQANTWQSGDLLYTVITPDSSAKDRKIKIDTLFANVVTPAKFSANLSANVLILTNNATPSSSGANCYQGQIWADSNYIYVAVANNTIKRVSLVSF